MKTTRMGVVSLLCAVVAVSPAMAANFVIVNGDGAGEGLNDPTPVSPVGGNTGTTLPFPLTVCDTQAPTLGALSVVGEVSTSHTAPPARNRSEAL